MENYNHIEFHRTRDFSRKMNATFEFVKQNFKSLGKSILLIAGPPVLVASLILGSFFGDFFTMSQSAIGNPDVFNSYFLSASFWAEMILAILFFMTSYVMTIATIYNYMILYSERRTNKIDVKDVWESVRKTVWIYFRTALLFTVVILAIYILMVIPIALLATGSPGVMILVVIILFCAFFYLLFSFSLTFAVRAFERKSFFQSLGRSFKLVQGKWWSTFGLCFVLSIIMSIISYIPIIPWYAILIVTTLHNVANEQTPDYSSSAQITTMIVLTVYYLFYLILSSLPNIGVAFQYFNLVEMKESKGLLGDIDTFGETKPPLSTPEEQY